MSEHCKDGEHKWWQDSPDDLVYCEKCRIYQIACDVKRYKQALEDIVKVNNECFCYSEDCNCNSVMAGIAEEALKDKGESR